MLGTLTERVTNRGRSSSYGARGAGSSTSQNESQQRRPLLLPQEFKELGAEHEVIVLEGHRPILAEKARYYADPALMARIIAPLEVPPLDLNQHLARVQRRHRPMRPDEGEGSAIALDQIAHDLTDLPPLAEGAPTDTVDDFVSEFFARLEGGPDAPASEEPASTEPHSVGTDDRPAVENTIEPFEVDLSVLEPGTDVALMRA